MEKDDEIKGEGNSYTTEYRMQDPRLGRFFIVDPHASSYPNISPYAYVANNPLIYIDPDGRDIIIRKDADRNVILGNLQKLTNDKLVYTTLDNGDIQVKIASLGNGDKPAGTNLIRRLNSSDLTVTIIDEYTTFYANPENKENASNTVGTNITVNFASGDTRELIVEDPITGNAMKEKSNTVTNLAHELIHAERDMRGEAIDYDLKGPIPFKDEKGIPRVQTVKKEEAATVGLKHNTKKDITENQIRKEQKVKKRIFY